MSVWVNDNGVVWVRCDMLNLLDDCDNGNGVVWVHCDMEWGVNCDVDELKYEGAVKSGDHYADDCDERLYDRGVENCDVLILLWILFCDNDDCWLHWWFPNWFFLIWYFLCDEGLYDCGVEKCDVLLFLWFMFCDNDDCWQYLWFLNWLLLVW